MRYRALSLFAERIRNLSLSEQFTKTALLYFGAEYKMGSENLQLCDCSGLICGTLTLMGFKIRITADEIMKNLTTTRETLTSVMVIGCKKDGKFKHIGIILPKGGSEVVYHSSYPYGVQFESLKHFGKRYTDRGYTFETAYLDWATIENTHGEVYGLDKELN